MAYHVTQLVYEVLNEVEKITTRSDKIQYLQKHNTGALRDVLRGTFDDSIVWLLPEGAPPYNPAALESIPSNLHKQKMKFTYFVKGGKGDLISAIKRERIFLDVLESIHPEDALVLLKMKDKKPPVKGLTKKLVQEAFPNLILR